MCVFGKWQELAAPSGAGPCEGEPGVGAVKDLGLRPGCPPHLPCHPRVLPSNNRPREFNLYFGSA
jgi:hypothetical protein